ncbi:MAG TPA: protein kinase [Gemmatimonadales bacterium]|nr:protein kinase [Gemmatimonadales bacterium]
MADLRAQLQAGLSGSYTLERELGRGGMATVFLAHDLKHDRPVALKVLHPEIAASLGPERFQREIRFAARLQHPHILTVLDSGATAGHLWFTMPYVEGESLRSRLTREGQLALKDALRITREAAQALHYAHVHHIIHRDIKPENILLTADGSTLVADFGIARALGHEPGEALTQTGMSVGTPHYMSPEQANGTRELDARTDVYSLGCVLYEMLAGEPPYTGPSPQVILMRRFTEPVPSARKVRGNVPEAVDRALERALAQVPGDRFPSAAAFAEALDTVVVTPTATPTPVVTPAAGRAPETAAAPAAGPIAVPARRRRVPIALAMLGLGFLVGLGVLFAWRRSHAGGDAGDAGPRRVAVLPFENLGDSSTEYFADGITDEVRGKLSQLPGLAVIARASSNEYRHSAKAPQQIARELGADYLLTATVRWDKRADGTSRVRVSPELVRVAPGAAPTTTWQQPFDAALTDVFQVQADIAGKVASALDVALGAGQQQTLTEKPTANLAAYDAFLKGEAATQSIGVTDPASLRRGIGFYEQAVALDPAFAQAWAQLARAAAYYYYVGTATPAAADAARRAAERAVALAPGRPEAQLALGDYYGQVRGDFARALAAYETGLKVAPSNADLLTGSTLTEQSLGRWEAALAHLERARELDPRSVVTARRLALTLIRLRRYPEALAAAERGLKLAPANLQLLENAAMVYLAQGDLAGARAVFRAAPPEIEPTALVAFVANYWDLYWVLDDPQQQLLLRLPPSSFDDDRGTWGFVLAQTYWDRGDEKRARAYADSSRIALEEQLKATPENAQQRVFLGLALAYLGRKADAIREGERALALLPISRDGYTGPYLQHQLARIYLLVGEPVKALDQLEPLLKVPYHLSPGWLRIDPTFAPLRGNPRFERLVAGG